MSAYEDHIGAVLDAGAKLVALRDALAASSAFLLDAAAASVQALGGDPRPGPGANVIQGLSMIDDHLDKSMMLVKLVVVDLGNYAVRLGGAE